MEPVDPQEFADRGEWRSWLADNHAVADAIWVITHKKASEGPGLRYPEGVEEALCFGWIDGQMRSVDEFTFVQRYTPRRKNSGWSPSNIERAERLIAEGLMQPAGLAQIRAAKADGRWEKARTYGKPTEPSGELARALAAEPGAEAAMRALAPAQRSIYVRWVEEAKTSKTREKRVADVLKRLRLGLKPGEPLE